MRTPRYRRAWRRRGRKAQVSAVATLFGLLLVVTFISNYLLYTLPPEASQNEFQHVLQVQNQVGALQATLNAQATKVGLPIPISSPVTLGTAPVPPFGIAGTGSVTLQPGNPANGTASTAGVTLYHRSAWAGWASGTPAGGCFGTGSGTCSACPAAGFYEYNLIASGTAATPKTYTPAIGGGAGCPTFFNVSGNYDQVTLTLNYGSVGPVLLQVNGSHDQVTLVNAASPTTAETVNINIYGTFNTYAFSNTAAAGVGSLVVNTRFVSSSATSPLACPWGKSETNDTLASFALGAGANIKQKLTWYNTSGIPNSYTVPQAGTNNAIIESWVVTPYTECAFTILTTAPLVGLNSIVVALQNFYIQSVRVALDGGAVVELQSKASSVMLVQPSWTFTSEGSDTYALAMTMFQLVPAFTGGGTGSNASISTVAGTQTTILTTQVLWTNTTTICVSGCAASYKAPSLLPLWFSVTTAYPTAWINFLETANQDVFTSTPLCLATTSVCSSPPSGTLVTVMAPMTVTSLTVTVATVQVSLD